MLQAAFRRFLVGARVPSDQGNDPVRNSELLQVPGTVYRVKARVDQVGRVADVVQPSSADKDVVDESGNTEIPGQPAGALDMPPAVPQAGQMLPDQNLGPLDGPLRGARLVRLRGLAGG